MPILFARLIQGALMLGRVAITWAPVVFEVYDRVREFTKKKKPEDKKP